MMVSRMVVLVLLHQGAVGVTPALRLPLLLGGARHCHISTIGEDMYAQQAVCGEPLAFFIPWGG